MSCMQCAGVAALVLGCFVFGIARADESPAITVIIRNHRFNPSEIDVPAGNDVVIEIRNEDASSEEFDLRALSFSTIVFGNDSETVRLLDVQKGRYPFFGDYHSGTAQGVLVAE